MWWCRLVKRCIFPILLTPGKVYVIFMGCILRSNGQHIVTVALWYQWS
ncbi:hypothetical protein GYH30_004376 [Glycine max]|nr:hypothetical protein GYH30_004376 [Glycine max]